MHPTPAPGRRRPPVAPPAMPSGRAGGSWSAAGAERDRGLVPAGPVEQGVRGRRGRGVEHGLAAERVVRDRLRGPEAGARPGASRVAHRRKPRSSPVAGRVGLGTGRARARRRRADPGSARRPRRRRPRSATAPSPRRRPRARRRRRRAPRARPRGPSCQATRASCSNRLGDGHDGTRAATRDADATTLPSSSAAIAFTDDVPMSIPTVTSVIGGPGGRGAASTSSCRRPFVRDALPPSARARAVEVGAPSAGLLDDRDERGDVPQREPIGSIAMSTAPSATSSAARSRRSRASASSAVRARASPSPMPVGVERSEVRDEAELRVLERCTVETVIGVTVAERASPSAAPPARAQRRRRHDPDDELAVLARARSASPRPGRRA